MEKIYFFKKSFRAVLFTHLLTLALSVLMEGEKDQIWEIFLHCLVQPINSDYQHCVYDRGYCGALLFASMLKQLLSEKDFFSVEKRSLQQIFDQ